MPHEKKRVFDKVKDTKQESGFVLSGTVVEIQRLVLTSAETRAKFGAAWCVRNGEASVYHVVAKGYIMQILQQHQETKYLEPQTHQSVGWRNQHKSRKKSHRNTASGHSQSRLCLRISTSPPPDRPSSIRTQHHQSTTLNMTMAGKKKIHISASTYLHEKTST